MNDIFRNIFEFLTLIVMLSLVTVILVHSGGFAQVAGSGSDAVSKILGTAMGNSGGYLGGQLSIPSPGFNTSGFGG